MFGKKNSIYLILTFLTLIACVSLCFGISENISYADGVQHEQGSIFYEGNSNLPYCWFTNSKTYSLRKDECKIEMCVFSNNKLLNLKILSHNLNKIEYSINTNNIVVFKISCCNYEKYKMEVEYYLQNNEKIKSSLYIIYNEYGFFYSDFSEFNAEDVFLSYLRDSQEDQEDIDDNIYNETLATLGNKDTYVSGRIRWIDGRNNVQNLNNAMVKAFDANSVGGDTLLGTTYTDSYGYYSITFQNNDSIFDHGGSDVYIKVYASDGNISVKTQNNTQYEKYQWGAEDVSTGSTTTINIDCQMGEDFTKAIEIFQAAITARYYAKNRLGTNPANVSIIYPYNAENRCFYVHANSTIHITGHERQNSTCPHSYEAWDVVAHEYGHHVSHEVGNINSPGGSHYINDNLAQSRNNKSEGIQLAWSEAWATVYGIISQNLYFHCPSNIPTAKNEFYESYNGAFIDLEYCPVKLGEACEVSICAILWDLYDSDNEDNDNITLTPEQWWDVTTEAGTTNFSIFMHNFRRYFPSLESALGYNLSYYSIGVSDIEIEWNDTTLLPPSLSWSNYSGWDGHPFDVIMVRAFNLDETLEEYIDSGNITSCTFSQTVWNNILSWDGNQFKVTISAIHSEEPYTGSYIITKYFEKPLFRTALLSDDTLEVLGPINSLPDALRIPRYTCGKEITSIANYAFYNWTNITSVEITNFVRNIGVHAFDGCVNLDRVYIHSDFSIRIGDYAFYNCPVDTLQWDAENVEYVGAYAFYGSGMDTLIISDNVEYVGEHAFGNNSNTTFYTGISWVSWNSNWNSSNRPNFRLCTFSENCKYVVSFLKTDYNPGNGYNGVINSCTRSGGYRFAGWYTNSDFTGESYNDIGLAPNGTLYAKWSSTSSCITEDSLITLANGSQVMVQDLNGNEELLVWNIFTGQFDSAPIVFIDVEPIGIYSIINLYFSDSTCVNVVDEHGFYDITLNKFVYLRNDAAQYIGHMFNKQTYDEFGNMIWIAVELINVVITIEETSAWSPVTYGHLCYYVNGMLSMPGAIEGLINIFEVTSYNLRVDQDRMQLDINQYGLYTYDEFTQIFDIPEMIFNAFNGQYLKIAIGKGLITFEEISNLIEKYSEFFV